MKDGAAPTRRRSVRRRRERRRRRLVQLVAWTAVLAVVAYAVTATIVVRRERQRQRDLMAAAQVDAAYAAVAGDEASTATEEQFAAGLKRSAERDLVRDNFSVAVADLGVAQGTLTTAEQALAVQQTRIGQLGSCITGVNQTLVQIGTGDRVGASATLAGSSAACNAAVGATGGLAPVFAFDFPDPYVLRDGDTYYAYSTNAGAGDIQVAQSTDLLQWAFVGNGLAGLPPWAGANRTWAPSVLRRSTVLGPIYVAYYTARVGSGKQCITRAFATSPVGPFVDDTGGPMVCPRGSDAIDPSPFVAPDGKAYLLWRGEGAQIWGQPLRADGLAVTGEARALIGVDQTWEGDVVEGPSMVVHDGRYYLLYSGSEWDSRNYAIGYAVCDSPVGPCTKPSNSLLIGTFASVVGPGGQEVFADADGGLWVAYHAFTEPNVGYPNSRRLHLAPLTFSAGVPVITLG